MAKRKRDTKTAVVPKPLTDAERSELLAWGERIARQPHPPCFKTVGAGALTPADGINPDLHFARIVAAFGSANGQAINVLSHQAAETCVGTDAVSKYNTGAALCVGINPRSDIEGMLAVQMVGCHNLAMAMLRRATHTDRVDFLATYGNLAAKLLRTFTMQTEALARLRGQTGQQTVRVEHVTVEAGGQAVVGAVATGGPGGPVKRE